MQNIIIVADQDRGKSHFVTEEIIKKFHNRPLYALDLNLEYAQYKNQVKGLPTRDEFLELVPCKTVPQSKILAIFGEATSYFSKTGTIPGNLNKHIFRRFHTGNINVFEFHGLEFVPLDMMPAADYFVLFRTSDDIDKVKKKFARYPRVIAMHEKVQKMTEGTKFDRENKTYPDERSKQFFHYKQIFKK